MYIYSQPTIPTSQREGSFLQLADSSVDNSTTVALREICCVVICLILSSCSRTICLVSGQDTRPYNRRGERVPVDGRSTQFPQLPYQLSRELLLPLRLLLLPAWHGHKNQKSIKIHLIILQRVLFCLLFALAFAPRRICLKCSFQCRQVSGSTSRTGT